MQQVARRIRIHQVCTYLPVYVLCMYVSRTVRAQAQRANPYEYKYIVRFQTIARSVHHRGCPCQMLRLSMSNIVGIALQVQRVSPTTRTIPRSSSSHTRERYVHCLGCPCQNTVHVVQAQYVCASTSTHVYYVHHPGRPRQMRYK